MRLLHTSDWHVGRVFHGRDLLREQEAVLGGLADLVADERVDVVVVSGDLFDRAVPNAEAVALCSRVLERLRAAGARVVVTPGNHDSAARLGLFGGFAAAGGLHLRTRVADLADPVLLADEHGPVALYGIPFLEPETARHVLGVPSARGHAGVLTEAMRRVSADLAARPGDTRSVVLAHAFVTGGAPSDSERTIAVGGVQEVSGSVFDGIDYAALGHLHGSQELADHLRYSGSPLAYSFSEAGHTKSVWLVELGGGGLAGVERRELPVPRPLGRLRGELGALLADPAHTAVEGSFLSVELTDRVRPLDALRRLQDRFKHAVHVEWKPEGGRRAELRFAERVRGRSDEEVTCCFVEDVRNSPPSPGELALLREAFAAAGREEGA
ncbi:exonuclease SbcCD subunit D [Actinosynnema mirum]|uniref:Nuclease SbcCD subunit D n=1 Tax=Actinosynnema mirum (strain ATCC 29888 / DSM 43827 / JCM 3225 / NBRC 14064 / NCIMB 13271 / NRRL B-12336 / IMRU 3971 / 101) TaxID=446462 RepID=C6WKU0_ACTMD|nr:exonuclease SbcCD subunit D [Actinosynnema mirum]ACU34695.1 nuclease SbcCD, D subunit [Actinosynnema mirum DSM 43827]